MATISEDTGEETPLQVSHFIFILSWNYTLCMLCSLVNDLL